MADMDGALRLVDERANLRRERGVVLRLGGGREEQDGGKGGGKAHDGGLPGRVGGCGPVMVANCDGLRPPERPNRGASRFPRPVRRRSCARRAAP